MKLRARTLLDLAVTVVGLVACLAAVVLINLIASERSVALDLTGSGANRISDRTRTTLDALRGDFTVVLAINSQTVPDPVAFRAITDLLRNIDSRSDSVTFTPLDLASNAAQRDLAQLVQTVLDRDREALPDRISLIETSAQRLDRTARSLRDLADAFEGVRDAIPDTDPSAATNRAYFSQRAGLLRVAASDIDDFTTQIRGELETPTGPPAGPDRTPIPDIDRFLTPLSDSARAIDDQLASLARDLTAFARSEAVDAGARDGASPLPGRINAQRDLLAQLADDVDRAEPLEALRVGTALQTGEVMLVLGPPDAPSGNTTVAVPTSALLVDTSTLESLELSGATWSTQRAEELLASALGAITNPAPPIVVLTHGETESGLIERAQFQGFTRRLSQRGIDLLEWAAANNPSPPSTLDLDPAGARPVVYVTLNPDSTAPSTGQPNQAGSQRAIRFADALRTVLEGGAPVLLSANPSLFPTYGDTDPLNPLIEPFGVSLRSGTPLLAESRSASGRTISTNLTTPGNLEGHPIAEAINALPALFPWPVPVEISDPQLASPLLTASPQNAWAEGEWITFKQTTPDARATIPSQPQPGGLRDETRNEWTLAATASRPHPDTGKPQRLVVVGSNGWYLDSITTLGTAQNQRSVFTYPANAELLEAAVLWLAGQEDLIARSATATPIATVKPLEPSRLRTLRWTLLLGLPAGVLALGVLTRLVFG
ncbi:MAG: hypothetical protein ACF8Q5_07140 [Phycisphaerales bacterium JB040]